MAAWRWKVFLRRMVKACTDIQRVFRGSRVIHHKEMSRRLYMKFLDSQLSTEHRNLEEGTRERLKRFRRRNHRDSASSSEDDTPEHLKKLSDGEDDNTAALLPWQLEQRQKGGWL